LFFPVQLIVNSACSVPVVQGQPDTVAWRYGGIKLKIQVI